MTTEVIDLSKSRAERKQHDDIVDWTYGQFERAKNARIVTERQWYINLAFYFGKQYVQLLKPGQTGHVSGSTRLWVPPAPYWRSRPVLNRIRPTIRTELAQLTNNKPNATIVPASAEDRDMYAAMAGEQIWESIYVDKRVKSTLRRAIWWNQVCGNGFLKSWWDFTKGPVLEETGQPQGDVCFVHETPFHIFVPDLMEEDIEDQPFVFHAKARSPEYVQMNFKTGVDGKEVRAHESSAKELLEESFLNLIGNQPQDKQRSVLVLEVWVKPGMNPRFPDGAMFTVVGNKIVQGFGSLPYSHGKYPFAKLDHIPGGKFYSTSSIEDLVSVQKEYNRTHGQIIENKNAMGKLKWVYERGALDISKVTSEPGQGLPYTPGFNRPEPVPPPNLPSYIMQTLDRLLLDWNDISGQHEVTQGQVPPGVTAGTAISFLQERDESKLSPTFDSLEEAIEKIAHITLTYVKDYWTEERLVKVTGPDGSFDALTFKGSDLGNNLDIRVEAGSALPTSKAAKQAFVMDLMKMGFIDPNDGLEVMDMGGITKIYEKFQTDRRQVQRENMRMSKVSEQHLIDFNEQNEQALQQDPFYFGKAVQISEETGIEEEVPLTPPLIIPVNNYDDHRLHINYHNLYRKGQAFETLPEVVKDLFDKHVMQHLEALGEESETMNPRKAAGLPPIEESELEPEQEGSPGPAPMPETEMGTM